jgi:hypothetical protein
LIKRLPESSKNKNVSPPSDLLMTLKRCQEFNISYDLMCELNFKDLQALVIEYWIDQIKDYFKRKQEEQNARRGISVRKASNEDIDNL